MNFLTLFRVNWSYIIFYTIDFFIILYVLQRFLFKKILKILEDRENEIKVSLENSKIIEEKKEEMEKIYRDKMIETQKESEDIIEKAKEAAENIRSEMLSLTKKESKKILEESEKEAQKFHDQMYENLKKEILDLVVITTQKALSNLIDEKEKQKIISKSIEYIKNEK